MTCLHLFFWQIIKILLRLVVVSATRLPSRVNLNLCIKSHFLFDKQESEITEMRQTIELLRKQSIQAGLTSAHMQSMGVQANVNGAKTNGSPTKTPTNGQPESQNGQNGSNMQRHHSTDSVCSINSNGSNGSSQDKKKKKGWVSCVIFCFNFGNDFFL